MKIPRIKFHKTKKRIGPNTFPEIAIAPHNDPKIGRNVNRKIGSPIPAKGPIIPTLTPEIALSSTSAPFALSCSNERTTSKIGENNSGVVLKNSRCRFNASARSDSDLYNFLMAGIIE